MLVILNYKLLIMFVDYIKFRLKYNNRGLQTNNEKKPPPPAFLKFATIEF